jgi:hypothetical protein
MANGWSIGGQLRTRHTEEGWVCFNKYLVPKILPKVVKNLKLRAIWQIFALFRVHVVPLYGATSRNVELGSETRR